MTNNYSNMTLDDDDDSPQDWHPITDFSNFGSDTTMDKTDFDKLDYNQPRDANWYKQKFPGFPNEVIEILAHCDGSNNATSDGQPNEYTKRRNLEEELKTRLASRFTVTFD
jgi:hypothetical protein